MKLPTLKPTKIIALLAMSLLLPQATFAFGLEMTPSYQPMLLARSGMSLDQAVAQVSEQTGGRVLSARTVSKNGKRVHRIKVLMPSGRVKIITKPAN